MSSGNSYISGVKLGAEPEEGQIREIVSTNMLLTPVMKSVLSPNELLIPRPQHSRGRPCPLRFEVDDVIVQLLVNILSAQF